MEDIRELFEDGPKAFDAAEFAAREFKNPPTLVHPFFPVGGVGILFGEGGVGKTRLALHMAMAVRDGGFFLTKYRCTRGKVGMLQVDTPPSTMHRAFRLMKQQYALDDMPIVLNDRAIDVIALARAVQQNGNEARPAWLEPLRLARCDLIILDSYRKLHGLDENDNATPAQVLWACRTLLGSHPAFLFIHHARKDAPGFMTTRGASSSSRGASALIDDNDWSAHLYKELSNGKETGLKVLEWTKAREPGEDNMQRWALDYDPHSGLLLISDRARSRALELAEVGLDEHEIVRHLVEEQHCTKSSGYKVAAEMLRMVRNEAGADEKQV